MKKIFMAGVLLCCFSKFSYAEESDLSKQFETCMDKSNGVTIEMIECMNTEIDFQDKRLNRAYKEVMAQLSAERKKQLQEAQRAWIKYRDANCKFYDDPNGGSLERIIAINCFMSATASRAKEIESFKE